MKHIAKNQHADLKWLQIRMWVIAFGLVISLIGLSTFKNIDDHFSEIFPKGPLNGLLAIFFGALFLAIFWAVLTAVCVWFFELLLKWQRIRGWPHYFFYAFKFSDGKSIAGWMRLALNPSDGTLDADGESFEADGGWTVNDYANKSAGKCVHWNSEIVSGGTFREHATCYILYRLKEFEAGEAHRTYRDGLPRFRILRQADLKANARMPRPSHPDADQYLGHQQAIDQENIYNLAYAESASVEGGTDKEIEHELSNELVDNMPRLLAALENLRGNLKEKV